MYCSLIEMITIYSLKYETAFVNDFRNHYDLFLPCDVRLQHVFTKIMSNLLIDRDKNNV
jgi:hypothetical protein